MINQVRSFFRRKMADGLLQEALLLEEKARQRRAAAQRITQCTACVEDVHKAAFGHLTPTPEQVEEWRADARRVLEHAVGDGHLTPSETDLFRYFVERR